MRLLDWTGGVGGGHASGATLQLRMHTPYRDLREHPWACSFGTANPRPGSDYFT